MTTSIPPTPGLDEAGALARMNGNSTLFAKLLRRFADQSETTVRRARELVDAGQIEDARREVHTIRGAAATLGLLLVVPDAQALERSIADGAGAPTDLLEAYERALAATVTLAREVAARHVPPPA